MTRKEAEAKFATDKVPDPKALTADALVSKTDEANDESGLQAPKRFKLEPEHRAAYEQGRAARRARIAKDDAPHGEGDDLDAWLAGYEFEEKNFG